MTRAMHHCRTPKVAAPAECVVLVRTRAGARATGHWLVGCLSLLFFVGCGAAVPGSGAGSRTPSAPAQIAPQAEALRGSLADRGPPDSAARPRASAPRLPEIVLDPKLPTRSLPELRVENIGLHIGGGPNDPETKAPFLNAVAQRFPSFMDCYRKNEDPAHGGSFGIDLHIGRSGGRARLEQPRTTLRGAGFRACVSDVFESVDFQRPKHGPSTISYALRFTLVDAP